jgi:hypothetical protein
VLLGSNRTATDERQVWNIQTGEMTGKVAGRILTAAHSILLSPDGAQVAFVPVTKRNTLEVRTIATGSTISIDLESNGPHDLIDFAGLGKLLVGHRTVDRMMVRLHNATTGRLEREFETDRPVVPAARDALAISPGGGYLALIDADNLHVYDLKTGTAVGQLSLAQRLAGLDCGGLSFSPDGSELAAVFFGNPSAQLLCWRVSDGKVVSDINFPQAKPQSTVLTTYRGHALDWIGDGRAWLLYGSTLLDRNKNVAAPFPAQLPILIGGVGLNQRHAIGPEHVATMTAGAKAGDVVLTVSPFDPDKPR